MAGRRVQPSYYGAGARMPSLDTEARCVVDKEWPEFDGYHCMTAHDMACGRRAKRGKLARVSHVRQPLAEQILHGWLPQIAGGMRPVGYPVRVSHEAMRTFAYSADGRPSSSGGICRNAVCDLGRDMPDAGTASASARPSTPCAARTWSPSESGSAVGNAISSVSASRSVRRV